MYCHYHKSRAFSLFLANACSQMDDSMPKGKLAYVPFLNV